MKHSLIENLIIAGGLLVGSLYLAFIGGIATLLVLGIRWLWLHT